MLLTGVALATLPRDDGEALTQDSSPASEAAARVAPNAHVLELLRQHRRAVYGDRAPYSLFHFAQ
jgi:hypothetical protein